MKTRTLNLLAGVEQQDREGGTAFIVEAVSALGALSVTWLDKDGQRKGTITNVLAGKRYFPGFEFGGYALVSSVDANVRMIVGYGNADVGIVTNVTVADATIINSDANPVPVKIHTSDVDSVNVKEVLGTTITDNVAVAVTAAITDVLAALATRRSVRILNQGANDVAIGGAGLTWAKRVIVLGPGDMWIEDCAPGAVIKAICNAALASTIGVQVIT